MPVQRIRKKVNKLPNFIKETIQFIAVILGAVAVAAGLEFFLVPNGFLDGGITGISILIAGATGLPLGLFIAILNIPFVILAWKFEGPKNAIKTIIGIAALSVCTILFHSSPPATDEFVLALGYGGVLLGLGVGIALRYGGALDGIESLAHILSERTVLEVDKIILGINLVIFIVAGFITTPEAALASFLLFYIVVGPMIKRVLDDPDAKSVQIISENYLAISQEIHDKMKKKVLFTDAHRDNLENDMKIITIFIHRSMERELTDLVQEIDDKAIIVFNDATTIKANML